MNLSLSSQTPADAAAAPQAQLSPRSTTSTEPTDVVKERKFIQKVCVWVCGISKSMIKVLSNLYNKVELDVQVLQFVSY